MTQLDCLSVRVATEFRCVATYGSGGHPCYTPGNGPRAQEEPEVKTFSYNQNPGGYVHMCAENFSMMCCFYMALCSHNVHYLIYLIISFSKGPCSKCPDVRYKMNEKWWQHLSFCLNHYKYSKT